MKCSNAQLKKDSLQMHLDLQELTKTSHNIKAKLFSCIPNFLCWRIYTKRIPLVSACPVFPPPRRATEIQ